MISKDINSESLKNEYEEKIEEIEKEEKKKRRRLWIIIIILIILLFLLWFPLFMLGYRVGKNINVNSGVGTGINTDTAIETGVDANNAMKIIQVQQNDIDASILSDLDIFENKEFNNEKIIAPFCKGSYNFKIENLTNGNVKYNIKMSEKNNWNINLKYKLKIDNIYIVGNESKWVDINDLYINNVVVPKGSDNVYTIEWYWEEAKNDTAIGEASNVEYKLTVDVDSEVYNGEV